jgi:ribosome-associated protein
MTPVDPVDDGDDGDEPEGRPSRSARKRAAEHLQRLGVRLLALPDARLQALALPEALLEALREARRIRGQGALARQHQYIGRLMRGLDPAPIEQALEAAAGQGVPRGKMRR